MLGPPMFGEMRIELHSRNQGRIQRTDTRLADISSEFRGRNTPSSGDAIRFRVPRMKYRSEAARRLRYAVLGGHARRDGHGKPPPHHKPVSRGGVTRDENRKRAWRFARAKSRNRSWNNARPDPVLVRGRTLRFRRGNSHCMVG